MPLPTAKAAANALAAQSRADILLIAERVANGETIAVIRADFRRAIVRQIVAQSALGRGGWERVDRERAGKLAATQFDYLEGFLKDAYAGKVTPVRIAQRAAMYSDVGRSTYENERLLAERDDGKELCSRILGEQDHCPDCVEWAALGFIPTEEMLDNYAIGSSICHNNCGCAYIFKRNENSPTAPAATRAIEAAQSKQQAYAKAKATKNEGE